VPVMASGAWRSLEPRGEPGRPGRGLGESERGSIRARNEGLRWEAIQTKPGAHRAQ
jgi:hypothetical protein